LLDTFRRQFSRESRYFVGGCQQRVHAAYRLSPVDEDKYLRQIWVISPVGPGSRGVTLPSNFAQPLTLDFHVAIAFRDKREGTMVYDPCLAPEKFVSEASWLTLFAHPDAPSPLITEGAFYDVVPRSSAFIRYSDAVHKQLALPIALARDSTVGSGWMCAEVKALLGKPDQLRDFLYASRESTTGPCANSFIAYQYHLLRWDAFLRPSQLKVPQHGS
jgi:hypothetical protein